MNNQLQKNLSNLLEFLQQGIVQAYDVGKHEVPEFIKEYLAWKFYNCLFNIIISLIIPVAGFFIMKWIYSKAKKIDDDFLVAISVLGGLCYLVAFIVCGVTLITATNTLIEIKTAPRVYLMEQVKYLISKNQ